MERVGQQEEVNNFVNDMIKNDEGLIDFITVFLDKIVIYSSLDYIEKAHLHKVLWIIDKNIGKLVDLKKLEPRIRKIFNSPDFAQLDDQKKLAIETFLNGKIKDTF